MSKPLNIDSAKLEALEAHARSVTEQANAGNAPASPRRLPPKVRSADLPSDIFKLISSRPRTTHDVCRFFGENIEKVEDILRELLKEGFVEIYKLSPSESFWCAIDAARGRKVTIAPPAPPPPPIQDIGAWREMRAFKSVRGKPVEVQVSCPAHLADPKSAQLIQQPDQPGSGIPLDADMSKIFEYPMSEIVKAAREEWIRRHPKSPKAQPPRRGQ
ncbi:hypothetical protein [Massilia sp. NP310]|uniref:hypothetical protein n=1 Tax=Massilia sp. NP310 TaxID=2861282 RepID=UPI001C62D5D3|nr:hypothetical protein [Massilia sp. NP310]QYG04025.1 hypothetical protein KY496_11905 [Massilia sp. NP310]